MRRDAPETEVHEYAQPLSGGERIACQVKFEGKSAAGGINEGNLSFFCNGKLLGVAVGALGWGGGGLHFCARLHRRL